MNRLLLKKGQFYFIYQDNENDEFVLEDKTKRGLEMREKEMDVSKKEVNVELGIIYDLDGIGHKVPIRWIFPKTIYKLDDVEKKAEEIEKKYTAMREMTCPDD